MDYGTASPAGQPSTLHPFDVPPALLVAAQAITSVAKAAGFILWFVIALPLVASSSPGWRVWCGIIAAALVIAGCGVLAIGRTR